MKYYVTKINDNGNIAVDDTILVKDVQSAAGSRMLEGFKPLFSAEAVTRLENKGYTISGKTNVGEFGLMQKNLQILKVQRQSLLQRVM